MGDVNILSRLIVDPSGALYFANLQSSIDPTDLGVYKLATDENGLLTIYASDGLGQFQKVAFFQNDTITIVNSVNVPFQPSNGSSAVNADYVDNIIGSMIDTLVVIDPDAKIRRVNKAMCELSEYKEDELIPGAHRRAKAAVQGNENLRMITREEI